MKRTAHVLHTKPVARQRKERKVSVWKELVQFFVIVPILFVIVVHSLFVPQVEAASGINKQINFQGKLVDNNGLNVADSSYSVVFSLYTVSSGGAATWTETDSVSTANGVFQVALGAGTPFPGNVDFNSDTWYLGIKVGSDAEMTPRVRFSAVPYAFNAAALDGIVATNSATQFTLTGATSSPISLTVNGSLTLGSTIQPTANGALTIQSTGSNGLTLDTGGAATLAIGATANSITFGATNNPTYSFNGTGAVTFQGTSFTLGNGSNATIQTTSNAGLTLLSSGTGNITLGQNSGVGGIVVQPNAGGNAALIINKQASLGVVNPNIFVASSAGVLKFAVDSGGNATAAGSLSVGQPSSAFTNAIGNFSGNVNNFLQVQVQNKSNGNAASTDFIATADNGTDTTNYIDLGINGSGYNQAGYNIGGANDGYLYTSNGALTIGTASNKPLIFHTNGTTSSNEVMRIDALGKVGVGTVGTNGQGNGQLVVNQTNNSGLGDIFSASAAGVTKFIVQNDGTIKTAKYGTQNGLLYISATDGTISETAVNSGAVQCLTQTSSGVPTWGSCAGSTPTLQQAYNAGQTIDLSQAGSGLTIGTNAGIQNVIVAPNAGGQAALIVNDQGSGDLFTASSSGTTKFKIANNGQITISSTGSNNSPDITVPSVTSGAGNSLTINAGNTTAASNYGGTLYLDAGTGTTSPYYGIVVIGTSNAREVDIGGNLHQIPFFVNGNMLISGTISAQSTSGDVTMSTGGTGNVLLGDNTQKGTVLVQPNAGGKAALTINKQGSTGDIFTASSSGTTKFVMTNGGTAIFGNGVTAANALTQSALTVNHDGLGNSVLDINQTGLGDIFTASAAGATKLSLSNTGTATFYGSITSPANSVLNITSGAGSAGGITIDTPSGGNAGVNIGNTNAQVIRIGNSTNTTSGVTLSSAASTSTAFNINAVSESLSDMVDINGPASSGGLTGASGLYVGSALGNGLLFAHLNTGVQGAAVKVSINDKTTLGSGSVVTAGFIAQTQFTTSGASTKEIDGLLVSAPSTESCTSGACTWNGVNIAAPTDTTNVTAAALKITQSGTTLLLVTNNGTEIIGNNVSGSSGLAQSALTVAHNGKGNSVLDINQTGSGDIFTASASGATKFVLGNGGSVSLAGGQTSDVDTIAAATLKIGGSTQNGLTLGRSGATTTINGSGITLLSSGSNITLGQNSGLDNIIVAPNAGGNAALIINKQGSLGDIFTASASGTTKFVITNGGTAVFGNGVTSANALANSSITINGDSLGNAAVDINQTGGGDLLTASTSGTTRFRITNSGGVLFQGDTIASIGSGASGNGSNAVVNATGDQGSMIPNAGFESAISSSLVDGWFPAATTSAGIYTRDTSTPAKGTASLLATPANGTTVAIYSSCIPVAGGLGSYTLNYYAKASSATKITIAAIVDTYASKANCQADTSVALSVVKAAASVTTAWAQYGSGTTAIGLPASKTWARVHFLIGSTQAGATGEIDGVRFTEASTGVGLDYAENYPTDPQNFAQAGDVVALKPSGPIATIIPATNQMDVIGVVSTNPGETLDDGSVANPKVPVALAGRIPTKVATENGPIHLGDYLTASDIPGVAVKAVTAGQVIGIALEDYTNDDPTHIGSVVMFVKNTYYNGSSALTGVGAGFTSLVGKPTLQSQSTDIVSSASAVPTVSLVQTNSVAELSVDGLATISGSLRVKNNGLFEGMLQIAETLMTKNFIVNGISDFFNKATFHNDVSVQGAFIVNGDTAGSVTVKKGQKTGLVTFTKPYDLAPVITASIVLDEASATDAALFENNFFLEGYSYVITNVTDQGFTVVLNKNATSDVTLTWTALGRGMITPTP